MCFYSARVIHFIIRCEIINPDNRAYLNTHFSFARTESRAWLDSTNFEVFSSEWSITRFPRIAAHAERNMTNSMGNVGPGSFYYQLWDLFLGFFVWQFFYCQNVQNSPHPAFLKPSVTPDGINLISHVIIKKSAGRFQALLRSINRSFDVVERESFLL